MKPHPVDPPATADRVTLTRRTLIVGSLAAGVLAACGGGDDDADTGDASPGPQPTTAPGPSLPMPTNTVPADVPDAYLPAIGPIDVDGAALPPFDVRTGITTANDPGRGQTAPTLLGVDFDGRPVRVDAAADGPTMVVFLAHWCPHCNAEAPRIVELTEQGRLPAGLNVVAVSTGPDPSRPNFPPGEWLRKIEWPWPVIADGVDMTTGGFAAAGAYGLSQFPFVVLLDGDGKVAARWTGETNHDEMLSRLAEYLPA